MTKIKTGQTVQTSGQYKPSNESTEVTFVKGKRVPPTKKGSTTFTLVDKTKHKGGKKWFMLLRSKWAQAVITHKI